MSNLNKKLLGSGTEGVLYETPVGKRAVLLDITLTNTTAAPAPATLYLVPEESTAGVENAVFYQALIPGNTVVHWSGMQVLNPQTDIELAGAGITARITGEVYTI